MRMTWKLCRRNSTCPLQLKELEKYVSRLQEWLVFTLEPTKKIWTGYGKWKDLWTRAKTVWSRGEADVILTGKRKVRLSAIVDYKTAVDDRNDEARISVGCYAAAGRGEGLM